MKRNIKIFYEAPTVRVLEIKQEGIICVSGDPEYNGFGDEEEM